MTDLTPDPNWSPVRQIETTDKVLGGAGGVANEQAQALLNRTEILRNASGILDASGKTQQEINNLISANFKFLSDFPTVKAASNWLAESVSNFLYIRNGETCTITESMLFTRIVGYGGKATVVVNDGVTLSFVAKNDGTDIHHLENLTFKILGHRNTNSDRQISRQIYDSNNNQTVIQKSIIKKIDAYGLTDINNIDSYIDDTNQTRCANFYGVKVLETAIIQDVNHYGFGQFYALESASAKAQHYETNVIGYNNETNVFIRRGEVFSYGEANNVGITNTETQKTYWGGKTATTPIGTNGKDSLMCATDHTSNYICDNIWAINAIEKSLYNQSQKTVVTNVRDTNCLQIGQVKHSNTESAAGTGAISNHLSRNCTNLTGLFDVNGYKDMTVSNIDYANDVKNKARFIIFRNLGVCNIHDILVRNIGNILCWQNNYITEKMTVRNITAVDCYNDSAPAMLYPFSTTDLGAINEINFENVNFPLTTVPSYSLLSNLVFDFTNVVKSSIKNCYFNTRDKLWNISNLTTLNLSDSVFNLYSTNNNYNAINQSLITPTDLKATVFDFKVNVNPTDTIIKKTQISFKNEVANGLVNVWDYWTKIKMTAVLSAVSSTNVLLIGARSIRVSVSCGTSKAEYVIDGVNRTSTLIYNSGTLFSLTKADNKICLSMDTSNRLNIDVGNSLTWTNGTKTIDVAIS